MKGLLDQSHYPSSELVCVCVCVLVGVLRRGGLQCVVCLESNIWVKHLNMLF